LAGFLSDFLVFEAAVDLDIFRTGDRASYRLREEDQSKVRRGISAGANRLTTLILGSGLFSLAGLRRKSNSLPF
jgi:hypothetical protein